MVEKINELLKPLLEFLTILSFIGAGIATIAIAISSGVHKLRESGYTEKAAEWALFLALLGILFLLISTMCN